MANRKADAYRMMTPKIGTHANYGRTGALKSLERTLRIQAGKRPIRFKKSKRAG